MDAVNMTAEQATRAWAAYQEYKVDCIRNHGEYLDYPTWVDLGHGFSGANKPDTSAVRKATPIFSGCLRYFPNALAAIARLSKAGNDKHNPGEPLHWSRGKSNDHGDCLVRHQMDFDQIDPETGEYHAVAVAWRALAQLELLEEKRK